MIDFKDYTVEQYERDIDKYGLNIVWQQLLIFCLNNKSTPDILQVSQWGELYEIGLAHSNKIDKKEMGKYFTPEDVAALLSDFFIDLTGDKICDVACGTGNLIIAFLSTLKPKDVRKLILSGNLYLYDIDALAMSICKHSIGLIYGVDLIDHINCVVGDFLSKNIHLPDNCKVISNPPYFKITKIKSSWGKSDVITESRELYSAFMEKIIKESLSSVIITPFSFIGSDKFYALRRMMNNYSGFIFSFDNVPANIFNGRKHGIFNTNCINSVRAAITVVDGNAKKKGFRVSPLIRFSTAERTKLLNKKTLLELLPNEYQLVDSSNRKYHKCFKEVVAVYKQWVDQSNGKFEDLVSEKPTKYCLNVPTTCRYFLSATHRDLARDGKILIYFKNASSMEYAYCLLNSSFAYWWWRIFDGGITYPRGLMLSIPIKAKGMSKEDKAELHAMISNIQSNESNHLIYKMNAQKKQENVKFPVATRDELNTYLLKSIGLDLDIRIFDCIHSNNIFGGVTNE